MSRRFWTAALIISAFACALLLINENPVFGLQFPLAPPNNPTIPTRTPMPGPTSPRPTATKSGGGGGDATAVPTSTIEPAATETAVPASTATFLPEGETIPTAEGCGQPPTIQAQNPINVRVGPGPDYAVVVKLAYLDVRPILGRAADAEWWLIQLEGGASGWVSDAVVAVQGYTGNVPVAPAPPINGQTPTPGALWNPTPNPVCTVAPTNTATPTPSAEPTTGNDSTATPTAESDHLLSLSNDGEETPDTTAAQSAATDEPLPTQTAVSPPTLAAAEPTNAAQTIGDSTPAQNSGAAAPLDDASNGSAADWLLPVSGLLLIAAGAVAFAAQRRRANNAAE